MDVNVSEQFSVSVFTVRVKLKIEVFLEESTDLQRLKR
jgi:hypothetical protein